MSDKKIEALVLVRDGYRMIADGIDEYLETLVPVEARRFIGAKEETFNILSFEKQQGDKLGEFELAHRKSNDEQKFQLAFGILQKSNANISARYHGTDYQFSYWLFGPDRIYRQRLNAKK